MSKSPRHIVAVSALAGIFIAAVGVFVGSHLDAMPNIIQLRPDVSVIVHTYDGTYLLEGVIEPRGFQYTRNHLGLEMTITTTDGIFRDGFETSP